MIKPLLIEIGTEELPAIPFLKELPNISQKWTNILEEYGVICEFDFFYTPRRLVLWHREFTTKTEDKTEELWGAPLRIALQDNDKSKPTQAGLGFAKKCGVEWEEITTKSKGKDEFLYYEKKIAGESTSSLLNDMINRFVSSLSFGKNMRWGSREDKFIRPIRFLGVMLGDELVDANLFGIQSSNQSQGLRAGDKPYFTYDFAGEYFCKIDKAGVILYQDERRKMILDEFAKIETQNNISIEIDEELLEEVIAITEYPKALIGTFDEQFLKLPDEVTILSMKEHQRYFACKSDDNLSNHFIVVANAKTDDYSKIIEGNEKVLRARLSDGLFFYENDLKIPLCADGLKDINFVNGLGSIYDKIQREKVIANILLENYQDKFDDINATKKLLNEAVELSKADLLTEVVYEFTELQGTMGYYYAKAEGKDELVQTAIKEQYLPDGENSGMPSNLFSSIVSLSNKIDTLSGLFSIGKIPKGSGDPFALRRNAGAIAKIIIEQNIKFDFTSLINEISHLYKEYDTNLLKEFFIDRLYQIFGFNKAVIRAVLSAGESDLCELYHKSKALEEIVKSDDWKEYATTFKRVANIIKDVDLSSCKVDTKLFDQDEERVLYEKFEAISKREIESYDMKLDVLFGLKNELDNYFDKVFVNHEDEAIKQNRKNSIGLIYNAFKDIADIKEITL